MTDNRDEEGRSDGPKGSVEGLGEEQAGGVMNRVAHSKADTKKREGSAGGMHISILSSGFGGPRLGSIAGVNLNNGGPWARCQDLEGKGEGPAATGGLLGFTRYPVSVCPLRCKFFSLTETPEDYTIIVDEEGFLELPSSEHLSVADATWLALNVVSGGGSFSSSQPIGVTKIAKSVIAPLADQNISVFMLSTYQTDFILVRERDLPLVTHTLSSEFTILRVVNGETVAAENLGITNGFVKPKLVQRPVIHPLSSPSNRFCVTSLDPDTLPAVATLLMDVMFYSNRLKDPTAAGDDGGHIRFFSFSLIEGYISLVMDVQTQQRFPSNLLFTSASGELWKMVRIGGQPLGFDCVIDG
ncbi:cytosolic arginine sensor for mTORC1 subunit 2 [Carlito syrichta]|uniref:Cytosolic arginine sensor for mTORC1 subunit 2 n=1 Tax=Carlito syrichta TaxID=1868482 RepID=A0A3Q0EA76_CARSF|nr:cytosolic arginine sensor for mTORC1 subunit 2 [Carlito syrichta]